MNPNSISYRDLSSSPSPSPSVSTYQISNVSSFSYGVRTSSSSPVSYPQTTRNMFPSAVHVSISGLTQVSITETLTRNYSLFSCQNGFGHDMNNNWNYRSNFPTHLDTSYDQILSSEPFNMIIPDENSTTDYFLNAAEPSGDQIQEVPQVRRGRKRKNVVQDEYDGRMHSLPCKKYGPYTCPKCNSVFDTSQKFAAHSATHYRSETKEEKTKRYCARNKMKMEKLNEPGNGVGVGEGSEGRNVFGFMN